MTSKKLAQLKAFLLKEGGGGGAGGGGGDGCGNGGGFAGTAFTVESSGFTPTYGGGGQKRKKKKDSKSVKKEDSSSFAEELLQYALDKSIELNKGVVGHKDMRNTDLKQTSP